MHDGTGVFLTLLLPSLAAFRRGRGKRIRVSVRIALPFEHALVSEGGTMSHLVALHIRVFRRWGLLKALETLKMLEFSSTQA